MAAMALAAAAAASPVGSSDSDRSARRAAGAVGAASPSRRLSPLSPQAGIARDVGGGGSRRTDDARSSSGAVTVASLRDSASPSPLPPRGAAGVPVSVAAATAVRRDAGSSANSRAGSRVGSRALPFLPVENRPIQHTVASWLAGGGAAAVTGSVADSGSGAVGTGSSASTAALAASTIPAAAAAGQGDEEYEPIMMASEPLALILAPDAVVAPDAADGRRSGLRDLISGAASSSGPGSPGSARRMGMGRAAGGSRSSRSGASAGGGNAGGGTTLLTARGSASVLNGGNAGGDAGDGGGGVGGVVDSAPLPGPGVRTSLAGYAWPRSTHGSIAASSRPDSEVLSLPPPPQPAALLQMARSGHGVVWSGPAAIPVMMRRSGAPAAPVSSPSDPWGPPPASKPRRAVTAANTGSNDADGTPPPTLSATSIAGAARGRAAAAADGAHGGGSRVGGGGRSGGEGFAEASALTLRMVDAGVIVGRRHRGSGGGADNAETDSDTSKGSASGSISADALSGITPSPHLSRAPSPPRGAMDAAAAIAVADLFPVSNEPLPPTPLNMLSAAAAADISGGHNRLHRALGGSSSPGVIVGGGSGSASRRASASGSANAQAAAAAGAASVLQRSVATTTGGGADGGVGSTAPAAAAASGIINHADCAFNPTTGAVAYTGAPLKIAKAVADAAAGAMILASERTLHQLLPILPLLDSRPPMAVYCGDVELEGLMSAPATPTAVPSTAAATVAAALAAVHDASAHSSKAGDGPAAGGARQLSMLGAVAAAAAAQGRGFELSALTAIAMGSVTGGNNGMAPPAVRTRGPAAVRRGVALYQLVGHRLRQRLAHLTPLRGVTFFQLGNVDAPVGGSVAITFLIVPAAQSLVSELEDIGTRCLARLKSTVVRMCTARGGYVIEAADGLCLAAFHDPAAAAMTGIPPC
ncbi:hypothetical protein GPECTOR_51g699 [Gonium pectorale]|uniref:Guanylate cyclase domain-containing protein n=1 Tax=Gonium pectorale TaxID=33097 RepID=A0A150G7G8_GONPE|nr:hypothetical protein GPECTOR_51g699 [Gonium pectorale]|eukprot:KXZ45713.1 hypothetical protein GPECTOR_51g699 [Gonium pectorale]